MDTVYASISHFHASANPRISHPGSLWGPSSFCPPTRLRFGGPPRPDGGRLRSSIVQLDRRGRVVGRTLSHYRVVERLGAGGMGEVYRAQDLKLDRDVALKVLPEGSLADEKARSRFRREAHALSRLSHPHVATLLDFDSEDGADFLVMELVSGPSLSEKLRDGPLPEKDILRLGAQLARLSSRAT